MLTRLSLTTSSYLMAERIFDSIGLQLGKSLYRSFCILLYVSYIAST